MSQCVAFTDLSYTSRFAVSKFIFLKKIKEKYKINIKSYFVTGLERP